MAQKNPPGQNNFLDTALECELISTIGRDDKLTAEELISRFPNPTAARNALEGCLTKHFVIKDETGHFALTESGRTQI